MTTYVFILFCFKRDGPRLCICMVMEYFSTYIFKPSTYKYTPIYANLSITVCAFDCVHTKYVRFGLGLCNFESHEAEHNVSSRPRRHPHIHKNSVVKMKRAFRTLTQFCAVPREIKEHIFKNYTTMTS